MPMTVHDALQAWSDGRLSTERAVELTGCADVDELLRACDSSDVLRPAAESDPAKVRWSIEDGTGCSSRVELYVRVLVGTERSTIIVSDPITGRAIEHDLVQHGSEAASAGAAVERAVRRQMAVNEVIAMVRGAPDVPPDPGDEW